MLLLRRKKDNKKSKANQQQNESIIVRTISEDFIPFANYLDKETVLTKNGEIMQVIEIVCSDNNANLKGQLKDEIKQALLSAFGTELEKYAVWIHVTKSSYTKIPSNEIKYSGVNYFSQKIEEAWQKNQKTFNNFYTTIYVTIIRAGMAFDLKPNNILLYTNKELLFRAHDTYVKRAASQLTKCTAKVLSALKNYKAKKLSIIKKEDDYYSEHLSFWHRILCFDTDQYKVPIISLANVINKAKYNFGFNYGIVKNKEEKKIFSVFTIKDSYNINSATISMLVESSDDLIFFEAFHTVPHKVAKAKYSKQLEIFQKNSTQDMLKVFGLTSLLNEPDKNEDATEENTANKEHFFRQYLGIIVVANSHAQLKSNVQSLMQNAINSGIIITMEDIGLERAFYSMIPSNFKFINHYNIVTQNEICTMANSYAMDNENITSYVDQKYLMLLPTLKKYPYAFGILENKNDIIISGPKYTSFQKNNFIHLIISNLLKLNRDIYMLGASEENKGFTMAADGLYYKVSKTPAENEFFVNLHNREHKDEVSKQYISYLVNVVIMMLLTANYKPTKDDVNFLSKVINQVVTTAKAVKLEDICNALKSNNNIYAAIQKWIATEENTGMPHIFSVEKDIFDEFQEQCKYNTEVLGTNTNHILTIATEEKIATDNNCAALVGYIFLNRVEAIMNQEKGSIVVIHNSLGIFEHAIFKNRLDEIIARMRAKKAFFIFINDDSKESVAVKKYINLEKLFENCNTFIHVSGTNVNEDYRRTYQLTNAEGYALKTLGNIVNSALIKQNGLVVPVSTSTDNLPSRLRKLISNEDDVSDEIDRMISQGVDIKDTAKWVEAWLSDHVQELIENVGTIGTVGHGSSNGNKKDDDDNTSTFGDSQNEEEDLAKAKEILNAA